MKILITENQLDNIIEKYIDSRLKNLEEIDSVVYRRGASRSFRINNTWVMEYILSQSVLCINESLLSELVNIFNISFVRAKEIFKKKFTKKFNKIREVVGVDIELWQN